MTSLPVRLDPATPCVDDNCNIYRTVSKKIEADRFARVCVQAGLGWDASAQCKGSDTRGVECEPLHKELSM
jgi:hypothetical protein